LFDPIDRATFRKKRKRKKIKNRSSLINLNRK